MSTPYLKRFPLRRWEVPRVPSRAVCTATVPQEGSVSRLGGDGGGGRSAPGQYNISCWSDRRRRRACLRGRISQPRRGTGKRGGEVAAARPQTSAVCQPRAFTQSPPCPVGARSRAEDFVWCITCVLSFQRQMYSSSIEASPAALYREHDGAAPVLKNPSLLRSPSVITLGDGFD